MCPVLCVTVAAFLCLSQISTDLPDAQALSAWQKYRDDGRLMYSLGHFTEAAGELEKAVHSAESFPAPDPRLAATIHSLAYVYQQQGRYPEAENMYLRAIGLWERIGPSQRAALFRTIDNLIGTYVEAKDYRAARKLLESRLPEMERSVTQWKERATLLDTRSGLAFMERKYGEAETLLREALVLWEQYATCPESNHAVAYINLSHVLGSTGRSQEALEMAEKAMGILEKLDAGHDSLLLRVLDYAASLSLKLGRPADAEQYYQRALPTARRMFGAEDSHVAQIELSYSTVLKMLHRGAEAKLMAGEAQAMLRSGGGRRAPVDILALTPAH